MSSGTIKIKFAGKTRNVWVSDIKNCKSYDCFHPHDFPVHGAKGVNSTQERWVCLTNALHGCPENPKLKKS